VDIDPPAEFADPLNVRQDIISGIGINQLDPQDLPFIFLFLQLVAGDVAGLFQDLGDIPVHPGDENIHRLEMHAVGVPDASQHICNWIGHSHE